MWSHRHVSESGCLQRHHNDYVAASAQELWTEVGPELTGMVDRLSPSADNSRGCGYYGGLGRRDEKCGGCSAQTIRGPLNQGG